MRAERPAGGVDPFRFLRRAAGLPRGFWERDGRWSAWAGSAAEIRVERGGERSPAAEVRERAAAVLRGLEAAGPDGSGPDGDDGPGPDGSHAAAVRFHGGLAFDPGDDRPPARGFAGSFPAGRFHLPALELRGGEGEEVRMAAVVRVPADVSSGRAARTARRALDRVLGRLEGTESDGSDGSRPPEGASRPSDGEPPRSGGAAGLRTVVWTPGRRGWTEIVETALEAVREGRLDKVVPARLVELTLDGPPDPVALLARLRSGNPGTFPFLVEAGPGPALLGAAPEIVASRADGRFEATAVAGTVPEGEGRAERERLARRLLESEKDREEHDVGVRDMREALLSVAEVAEVDEEPTVLRLRGMQHLLTHLSARVPDELHVLDLLDALHPTAAVNGFPRAEALRFLRAHEPFHRGWFAGPVGWFDGTGDGAFAPALRCALVDGDRARLFAGAGIVEGSRPDAEWEETSVKLLPVLRALGLDPAAVEARASDEPGRSEGAADSGAAGPSRVAPATGG